MSLNIRRLQIIKDVLFAEAGAPAPVPSANERDS